MCSGHDAEVRPPELFGNLCVGGQGGAGGRTPHLPRAGQARQEPLDLGDLIRRQVMDLPRTPTSLSLCL